MNKWNFEILQTISNICPILLEFCPATGNTAALSMRYQLLLCFVVVNLYLRLYLDILCMLILCCYRAALPVVTESQALCPSSGNIEMFPLLCQIQSQADYKEVIPLFIIHLESLPGSLDHTFLLSHQKCVTELGTLVLSSQKTYRSYSLSKYNNWLDCSQMESCTDIGCELFFYVYVNYFDMIFKRN